MFEFDPCQRWSERDEAHLDLGVEIGVVLPTRRDLPGQNQTPRRVPHAHAAPITFSTVRCALEPAAAGTRLDDRGLGGRAPDMMGRGRPPGAVFLREYVECARLAGLDGDLLAHEQGRGGA